MERHILLGKTDSSESSCFKRVLRMVIFSKMIVPSAYCTDGKGSEEQIYKT